jgi:hypothetical protein
MNEYFEYMTGYAVLILRAHIKVGVFITSRVTTSIYVCNELIKQEEYLVVDLEELCELDCFGVGVGVRGT